VSSLAIVFTYSRGSFLILIVLILAMLLTFKRNQMGSWLIVIVATVIIIQFVPTQFSQRIGTLTELIPDASQDTTPTDLSFRGRTSEMIVATQMFMDYPVLGVGLGNYPLHYQEYSRRLGLDQRAEAREAHSLYLEIAAESGLLGILTFGWLLWSIFSGLRQAHQSLIKTKVFGHANLVAAIGFGFSGYLMAGLFIHAAYPRYFWLLVGIALAIPQLAKNEITARLNQTNTAIINNLNPQPSTH